MENSSFLFGQNSHDIGGGGGGELQETVRYQLDLKQDSEEYSEFDYLKIVKNKVTFLQRMFAQFLICLNNLAWIEMLGVYKNIILMNKIKIVKLFIYYIFDFGIFFFTI